MTAAEILREVGEFGVQDQRLDSYYFSLMNRAVQQIANRRDWTFMKNRFQATIPNGQTYVELGPGFKKTTDEQSPVSYAFGIYNLPVYIASREEIEGRGIWPWTNGPAFTPIPGGQWPIRVVFIEFNAQVNDWTLNIPPQFAPSTALMFWVSAYFFPGPLQKGTDSNDFTNHPDLADAVVNLTKKLAYASGPMNDKGRMQAMQQAATLYEEAYRKASYTDAAQAVQGRTIRM